MTELAPCLRCDNAEGFWICLDGGETSYGPCEDDNCGGACEYKGRCDCECHGLGGLNVGIVKPCRATRCGRPADAGTPYCCWRCGDASKAAGAPPVHAEACDRRHIEDHGIERLQALTLVERHGLNASEIPQDADIRVEGDRLHYSVLLFNDDGSLHCSGQCPWVEDRSVSYVRAGKQPEPGVVPQVHKRYVRNDIRVATRQPSLAPGTPTRHTSGT